MTGRKQKLTRPRTGRMLSGVCAGLANFFGLDVSLVRIVYTPSLGSQIKDFGTKTHFFSKKK